MNWSAGMRKAWFIVLAILPTVIVVARAISREGSVSRPTLDRMHAQTVDDLRIGGSTFSVTVHTERAPSQTPQQQHGKFYLGAHGTYRLDLQSPHHGHRIERSLIFTGETLWAVNHNDKTYDTTNCDLSWRMTLATVLASGDLSHLTPEGEWVTSDDGTKRDFSPKDSRTEYERVTLVRDFDGRMFRATFYSRLSSKSAQRTVDVSWVFEATQVEHQWFRVSEVELQRKNYAHRPSLPHTSNAAGCQR